MFFRQASCVRRPDGGDDRSHGIEHLMQCGLRYEKPAADSHDRKFSALSGLVQACLERPIKAPASGTL